MQFACFKLQQKCIVAIVPDSVVNEVLGRDAAATKN